jgi:hypothetical protein
VDFWENGMKVQGYQKILWISGSDMFYGKFSGFEKSLSVLLFESKKEKPGVDALEG